jgi:hypothetical protein
MEYKERRNLSANGLIRIVNNCFQTLEDEIKKRMIQFSLKDCLMSALAIFSLKYPSLLKFEKDRRKNHPLIRNIQALYKLDKVPSDTQMRERVDAVDPKMLSKVFKILIRQCQKDRILEDYRYMDDYYLLSIDGTGYYHSKDVFCKNCCTKKDKEGNIISYHHDVLTAAIVHPGLKTVLPLAPEFIIKQDGEDKNDCELNAAKRMIPRIKKEYPHLKITVLVDAIAGNAPYIQLLEKHNFQYIIVVKEADHKYLFDTFMNSSQEIHLKTLDNGNQAIFRFANKIPLNKSNPDCLVNFLTFEEHKKDGKVTKWAWVTNIKITGNNCISIMKGGRCRWKIENETFNTLKNQGYNFEHNYGHGKNNLSTIFAMLMLLAFMIDQIQQHSCSLFKGALDKAGGKNYLWCRMREFISFLTIDTWKTFFLLMIVPPKHIILEPDTG